MWICNNDGFISAVIYDKDETGNTLAIRARFKADLERIFPDKTVIANAGTDYKYRIYISKQELAKLMYDRIMNIDYTNFKDSVSDHKLHNLYNNFWYIGYTFQHEEQNDLTD